MIKSRGRSASKLIFTEKDVQMIRKCLFPAAGYGTRFLPATKAMPKEVMPIVNKPLIEYGVEEAMAAGDAKSWLLRHQIIDHNDQITWQKRQ